jgi:ElaB/YqjD/DUF883 family membrane-anchored ribosome-binding protein
MTCSEIDGIDDDFSPYGLTPIPMQDQKATWNGRTIQVSQDSHILQIDTIRANISQNHIVDPHFCERLFSDLVFEDLEDTEEEGRDWFFAPAQELFSAQISEDMTLEQFLERTGMTFDRELGRFIDCKSWIEKMLHSGEKHLRRAAHSVEKNVRKTAKKAEKKARKMAHSAEKNVRHAAHSAEKNVRHAAKETEKFVRHHKKEVIIVAAAVVVVVLVLQIPGVGQAVQTAVVAALTKLFHNMLNPPRKEEELVALNSLPEQSASPPNDYDLQVDNFMRKVFGDLLPPKPTLPPNPGIYTLDTEQKRAREPIRQPIIPPSFKAPNPSYAPPSPNGNFVQQFYDNLFQANPNLHPHKHVGKMQPPERTRPPTPSIEESIAVPNPSTAPSAPASLKSNFGMYLDNLRRSQIDPNFQQYARTQEASAILPVESSTENTAIASAPPIDNAADKARMESWVNGEALVNLLNSLKQGVEIIGRGMIDKELLDPNTPLDLFNSHYPQGEAQLFPARQDSPLIRIEPSNPELQKLLSGDIPLSAIFELPERGGFVPFTSANGEMHSLFLYANKDSLKCTQEELDRGSINLYNHMGNFIPKEGKQIGICTSINGINTSTKEFGQHCRSDIDKIEEITGERPSLYLGIYNPTEGFFSDLFRFCKEKFHGKPSDAPPIAAPEDFASGMMQMAKDSVPNFQGLVEGVKDFFRTSSETQNVEFTREILSHIATVARDINPHFRWLFIEHSEGGLVFCKSFEGMSEGDQKTMHGNTIHIALAPAEPISKEMGMAVNFYSDKDYVTKRFAEKLLNHPNYDISIIPCKSSIGELMLFFVDHGREETTYTEVRDNGLKDNHNKHGFYNGEKTE